MSPPLFRQLDMGRGGKTRLFPEDDVIKLLQDVVTGEDLHEQFQLILLPEVLEGALRKLLPCCYLAFHLVQHLDEKLVHLSGFFYDAGVHGGQLSVSLFEGLQLIVSAVQLQFPGAVLGVYGCGVLHLFGGEFGEGLVAFEIAVGHFGRKGPLAFLLPHRGDFFDPTNRSIPQQFLHPLPQRLNLLVLRANLSLQVQDNPILLVQFIEQLPFVVLQEADLVQQCGQYSFILVVLNLLLVIPYPVLVLLQRFLNSLHVIFVGIDELGLLSLQHHGHLILQIISKEVHSAHGLLNFPEIHLHD